MVSQGVVSEGAPPVSATVPPALSRISEDSRVTGSHQRRCVNIAGIEQYPELMGGLPRAWSSPSLGPNIRSGLRPPLLQQAAFDDLVFRVDVMRNVASRSAQTADDEPPPDDAPAHWSSMPALPLNSVAGDGQNGGEEELQEVSTVFLRLFRRFVILFLSFVVGDCFRRFVCCFLWLAFQYIYIFKFHYCCICAINCQNSAIQYYFQYVFKYLTRFFEAHGKGMSGLS